MNLFNKLKEIVKDEESRINIQFAIVYSTLGLVSLFMSIVNIFTHEYVVMWSTLAFFVVMVINLLLSIKDGVGRLIAKYLFSVEILCLFCFFMIKGEPEGFSILWSLLLPSCGLLLYKRKHGSIICGILFILIIFFLWTPWGNSLLMHDYFTSTFKLRFPFLYVAFFAVGFLLESIRSATQKELVETRENYKYLYSHDALTSIYNRYGFNNFMNDYIVTKKNTNFAFFILDIDFFKNVNDKYGHQAGDILLKDVTEVISRNVSNYGDVARWGGEEFAVLIYDSDFAVDIANNIISDFRTSDLSIDDELKCSIRVSIGLVICKEQTNIDPDDIVKSCDANLYDAKRTGRDKLVVTEYTKNNNTI